MTDTLKMILDILSAKPDQRWTPATWTNDDGEWVARGPKRMNREPPREPGEDEDDYAHRVSMALMNDESGCDGDLQAQVDAGYMCFAVNLAPYMAAVVKAARDQRALSDMARASEHVDALRNLSAALDDLEAAAKESK